MEGIPLRGFLRVLRILAVNAGQHFHREDAKYAKKTLTRLICGWAARCFQTGGLLERPRAPGLRTLAVLDLPSVPAWRQSPPRPSAWQKAVRAGICLDGGGCAIEL